MGYTFLSCYFGDRTLGFLLHLDFLLESVSGCTLPVVAELLLRIKPRRSWFE
jgi:hypothetical protein